MNMGTNQHRIFNVVLAAAATLSGFASPSIAMAEEACPLIMPQGAIATSQVPAGWKGRINPGIRLTSAGMLHGPFDGSGYLKPATTELKKAAGSTTNISTWDFGPPPHYPKWLVCEYGSVLELFKPIGEGITSCTMVTTTNGRSVGKIALECRGVRPNN